MGGTMSEDMKNLSAPEELSERDKRNEAFMKKKQAEMEHAENYRRKLREEKERARELAAKRKANRMKAEAEKQQREAEIAARENAKKEGEEEARRRNAESDHFLDRAEAKTKENEQVIQDMEDARAEAIEKAKAELEAIRESMQATSAPTPKPNNASAIKPEAPSSRNENKSVPQKSADNDFIISFDDDNNSNKNNGDDDTLTIDFDDLDNANNTDGDMLTVDFDDEDTKVETPKAEAKAPAETPTANNFPPMPEPIPMPEPPAPAPAPMDPIQAYLFSSPTYKQMKKKTNFGKGFDAKRKQTDADVAEINSTFNPNKRPTKSDASGGYRYASARAVGIPTAKQKKNKTPKTNEGMGGSDDESNLGPSLGAVSAVGAAGAITAALALGALANSDKETTAAQINTNTATLPAQDNLSAEIDNANEIGEETGAKELAAAAASAALIGQSIEIANERQEDEQQILSDDINKANETAEKEANAEAENSELKKDGMSAAIDDANESAERKAYSDAENTVLQKDGLSEDIKSANDTSEQEEISNEEKSELTKDGLSEEIENANKSAEKEELSEEEKSTLIKDGITEEIEDANDSSEIERVGNSIYSDEDYDPGLFDENAEHDSESNAAHTALSAAGAAYLASNSKEAKRYKKINEDYQKSLLKKEAEAREKHYEWGGDISVIHLKECADIEKLLIESYSDSYKAAAAQGDEKEQNKYLNKVQAMVDEYNLDMVLFANLTGEEPQLIPEHYVDNLMSGNDLPEIPVAIIPEEILERVPGAREKFTPIDRAEISEFEFESPKTVKEAEEYNTVLAKKALLAAERDRILNPSENTTAPDEKEITSYFDHAEQYQAELIAEELITREKQLDSSGDLSVIYLKECMDLEKELINSYADSYRCALEVNNEKLAEDYKDKLAAIIDEYNIDLQAWSIETDEQPKYISKSCLESKEGIENLKNIQNIQLPDNVINNIRAKRSQYQKELLDSIRANQEKEITTQEIVDAAMGRGKAKLSSQGASTRTSKSSADIENEFDIFEVFLAGAATKTLYFSGEDRSIISDYEREVDERRRKLNREQIANDVLADNYEAAMLKADIKAYKQIAEYERRCLKKQGADRETIRQNDKMRQSEIDALVEQRKHLSEKHELQKDYVKEANEAADQHQIRRSIGDAKHIGEENENNKTLTQNTQTEQTYYAYQQSEKTNKSSTDKKSEYEAYEKDGLYERSVNRINEAVYETALLKKSKSLIADDAKELKNTDNLNKYEKALDKDKSEMIADAKTVKAEEIESNYAKALAKDKSEMLADGKKEMSGLGVALYHAALLKDKSEMLADAKAAKAESIEAAYDASRAKDKSEMLKDAKANRTELDTAIYHAALLKDKSEMLADAKAVKAESIEAAYDASRAKDKSEMLADATSANQTLNTAKFDRYAEKKHKHKEYKTIAAVSVDELAVLGAYEKAHSRKQMLIAAKQLQNGNVIRLYEAAMHKNSDKLLKREDKKEMILDYEKTKLLSSYNKHQQKRYEGADDSSEIKEMRDALITEAINQSDRDAIIDLANRDLRKFLNKSQKSENKLIKEQEEAHKKYLKSSLGTAKEHLRKCIEIEHQLLQSYVDDFIASLCVRNAKYIAHYDKKVTIQAEAYRTTLELWKSRTGESVPYVSKTLSADIKNGDIEKILTIEPKEELPYKIRKKEEAKNMLQFAREEEKREEKAKLRELELKPVKDYDGGEVWITETQMKLDLQTVRSKIEHRTERYVNYLELRTYRFGEDTPKDKKTFKDRLKKLRDMRRGKRALLKYTKSNNAKLLAIANMNVSNLEQNEVKQERIEILHKRILSLLMERDEINLKLMSLYADENTGNSPRKNNQRRRIAKIRLKASKRAFKKQIRLYKMARKYRVPELHKDRIFEVMNRKIDLRAYLAECKYRKRHEKPTARKAKKILRKKMKDTKLRLKYAKMDFDRFMTKAGKRSRRTPDLKVQLFWFVILCCMIVIGVGAYLIFKYNKELVISYAKSTVKKVFAFVSKFFN